jgi:hypothetical protein
MDSLEEKSMLEVINDYSFELDKNIETNTPAANMEVVPHGHQGW